MNNIQLKSKIFQTIKFILYSFLFIFIQCKNDNPDEIINNYLQISSLSSGNSINLDNLICSYDTDFSNQINIQTNNSLINEKNIICFQTQNKELYIFNNNTYYLYKFTLDLQGGDFSINPYIDDNNNLICIISFLEELSGLNIVKYNLNITSNKFEKSIENQFDDENIHSLLIYNLGCRISDIYNRYLTCCFLSKEYLSCLNIIIRISIVLYNYNSTNITIYNNSIDFHNIYKTMSINKNNNIIFLCYQKPTETSDINCFFYNSSNSSFIYKNEIKKCKDSIKSYYFQETKEFVLICKKEGKEISIYNLSINYYENEFSNSIIKANDNDSDCNYVKNFFINVNYYDEEYNLINDCYNNNTYIYLYNFSKEMGILYNLTNITNTTEKSTTNLKVEYIIYLSDTRTIDQILLNLTDLFKDKEVGQSYSIKNKDYTISIRPINSITIPSSTHLNLTQCELILRERNQLNSSIITLFQLEIMNENNESLVNKVEYKLYDENFTELDINECNDIEVIYGIKKGISIDYDKIIIYQNLGINVFNLSDIYFNEICQINSNDKKDIILEDRIKDIFLNYSVCENGCTYKSFDSSYYTFTCECGIKNNITTEIQQVKLASSDISTNNFQVLKCFNLVFSFEDKINNIGFYIFTFVLGGHLPLIFHYINTGIKPIEDFIMNEMSEYGYIKGNKNSKKNSIVKMKRNKKGKKGKKRNNNSKNNKKGEISKENDENKENNLIEQENEDEKTVEKEENENYEKDNNTSSPPLKNSKKTVNNQVKYRKNKGKSKTNLMRNKKFHDNYEETENPYNLDTNKVKRKRKKLINSIRNIKIKSKLKNKSRKKISITDNKSNNSNNNFLKNSSKSLGSNFIQIQDFEFQNFDEEEEGNDKIGINLININLNKKYKKKMIPQDSNKILNNYTYEEALEYDRRPFFKIFIIFLLSKQALVHTFIYKAPLELMSIRILLLIFIISNNIFFNAFFYFNTFISKRYRYSKGLFFFTFTNTIIIIFLSIIVGFIMQILFTKLSNSNYKIREIFRKEEEKLKSDKNYKVTDERKEEIKKEIEEILKKLKIKNIILFIVEFVVMLFYWYYITAFCHVYTNTQVSWILDSFLTIVIGFIMECLFFMLFAGLYRIAIDNKVNLLYKFVMFLYNFC